MVGLSGGKDSWALIQILDVLRQRAPITFSLVAVTVDSGYDGYRHDLISKTCEAARLGIPDRPHRDRRDDRGAARREGTPCSLCARFRRGVLYRLATEVGATKIALGHHLDDFIETLLLNLFFAGTLKAMPARLVSDDGQHVVITPARGGDRIRGEELRQGLRAPDHRLLLPGVRRPRAATPAGQATDRRARGRAPRHQELDDSRDRERRARGTSSIGGCTRCPSRASSSRSRAPSQTRCRFASVSVRASSRTSRQIRLESGRHAITFWSSRPISPSASSNSSREVN